MRHIRRCPEQCVCAVQEESLPARKRASMKTEQGRDKTRATIRDDDHARQMSHVTERGCHNDAVTDFDADEI